MDIYNYDGVTGVYLGPSVADPDPLDDENTLIPAFATTVAPPDELAGFDRVFSEGEWKYVERGHESAEPTTAPVIPDSLVREEAGRRLQLIARPYTPEERETWAQQVLEAKAVIVDENSNAPLLTLLAAADGVTVVAMAETVLQKAELFSAAAGAILAAQRTLIAMQPIPLNYADDSNWP